MIFATARASRVPCAACYRENSDAWKTHILSAFFNYRRNVWAALLDRVARRPLRVARACPGATSGIGPAAKAVQCAKTLVFL
jgi:hypothetical protein